MKRLSLLLLLIPFLSLAQEKGIQFEHETTWAQVKAKAKTAGKFIFVDCYTTWCGPCIWMSENIFPQQKVGDFFNANFINLKIQMDQTPKDSEDTKSWYEEAKRFEKDYLVRAYPTFLIFDTNGELVHRIVGGGEADAFINKAKEGLNPETQYSTLVRKFDANPTDTAIAKATATAARKVYDEELAEKAQNAFLNTLTLEQKLAKDNIPFLLASASSLDSEAAKIIREYAQQIDLNLGQKKANTLLATLVLQKEMFPKVFANEEITDINALAQELQAKYPDIDLTASIRLFKPQFYQRQKNWPLFKDAVNDLINADAAKIPANSLNSFAWTIFENCDDPACLQAALDWSKKSVELAQEAAFLDTYANLLYKTGDKENAIKWSEKALAQVDVSQQENYQLTLDKMKKGEPTW